MKTNDLMPGDVVTIDDYSYSMVLREGELTESQGWFSYRTGKCIPKAEATVLDACGIVLPSYVHNHTNDTIIRRHDDDAIIFITHKFLTKKVTITNELEDKLDLLSHYLNKSVGSRLITIRINSHHNKFQLQLESSLGDHTYSFNLAGGHTMLELLDDLTARHAANQKRHNL